MSETPSHGRHLREVYDRSCAGAATEGPRAGLPFPYWPNKPPKSELSRESIGPSVLVFSRTRSVVVVPRLEDEPASVGLVVADEAALGEAVAVAVGEAVGVESAVGLGVEPTEGVALVGAVWIGIGVTTGTGVTSGARIGVATGAGTAVGAGAGAPHGMENRTE